VDLADLLIDIASGCPDRTALALAAACTLILGMILYGCLQGERG
jgi:hypothetical protein